MKLYLKLILKENAAISLSQGNMQSKDWLSDLLHVQIPKQYDCTNAL